MRARRKLSAGVHRSEAVSLCHSVVPVFDSLAMITRGESLYQTADETPGCVIVRMPTPPPAGATIQLKMTYANPRGRFTRRLR